MQRKYTNSNIVYRIAAHVGLTAQLSHAAAQPPREYQTKHNARFVSSLVGNVRCTLYPIVHNTKHNRHFRNMHRPKLALLAAAFPKQNISDGAASFVWLYISSPADASTFEVSYSSLLNWSTFCEFPFEANSISSPKFYRYDN